MASEGDKYWNADEGNLVQRLYLARASGVIISGSFSWARLRISFVFVTLGAPPSECRSSHCALITLRSDRSALWSLCTLRLPPSHIK